MKYAFDRRKFLLGSGGVAFGLPLLESLSRKEARAQAADGRPRRIIFEFKPNGDQVERRFDTVDEKDFVLGEFLAPLEPYRKDLLFLHNLGKHFDEIPHLQRPDRHQQGGCSLAPWAFGEGDFPVGGEDRTIGYVLGPSADYVLGDRVLANNPSVPYRHLVQRVGDRHNDIRNLSAHAGPTDQKNPVIPETDPITSYARLFGFFETSSNLIEHNLAMERSVLDLLGGEFTKLQRQVSVSDQQRLELHAEAIRDLERTLVQNSKAAECKEISLDSIDDPYANSAHVAVAQSFFKITALAFACDLTRVVNFNWAGSTSQRVYMDLGLREGHHDISHRSDEDSFTMIRKIHKHLWEGSVGLYEELLSVPDGEGTLWDSTAIVHWNELGQGDTHSFHDCLVVIAGGADQYFKKGTLIDYENGGSFSDLLTTLFHYMGFDDVERFGDERMSARSGPMVELLES